MKYLCRRRHGQILGELLIAIAVGITLAAIGAQLLAVSLNASKTGKERNGSGGLAQEAMEAVRAIARGNDATSQGWNRIYLPPDGTGSATSSKGSANPYYPALISDTWRLATGTETITLHGDTFTRSIVIDNISRDASTDAIESTYTASRDDPATQKVTVTVSKNGEAQVDLVAYISRYLNEVTTETDFSGSVDDGPFTATATVTNVGSGTDATSTVDRDNASCEGGGACIRLKQ
jgi:hypothetical protein